MSRDPVGFLGYYNSKQKKGTRYKRIPFFISQRRLEQAPILKRPYGVPVPADTDSGISQFSR